MGGAGAVLWYSRDLPTVEGLRHYRPKGVTRVLSADGRVVGEFFEEQRYVLAPEELPERVVHAFVDAEDASFFQHRGVDPIGILRAAFRNIQEGRAAQGGSTITQQVARSFLLTNEKRFARKIKEALLAVRIEKALDKQDILHLYLNQIFLGNGAYGVEAAARLYFGKTAQDLSLAEAALIAGLPQAPSRYTPIHHFSAAKARQRYVLDRMISQGHATAQEAETAYAQALSFAPKASVSSEFAPHYVELVRKLLVEKYGHDRVYQDALTVEIPLDASLQAAAMASVQEGTRRVDEKTGFRGVLQHVPPAQVPQELHAIDLQRFREAPPYDPSRISPPSGLAPAQVPPLRPGEPTSGIVSASTADLAVIQVGSRLGVIPLSQMRWASPASEDGKRRVPRLEKVSSALSVGDKVAVRVLPPPDSGMPRGSPPGASLLTLQQEVQVDGALLSLRLSDGAVLAMVGGRDFAADEFNLATQARRQAGSTFKPLVYAAALDAPGKGYSPSSIVVDAPVVGFKEGEGGEREIWRPENADNDFLGDTTFRRGLVLSRNNVTLRILQDIGVNYLQNYLVRFGFASPLRAELGMGLGSNELTLEEMVRGYSVFPLLGSRQDPLYLTRVRDRDQKVLEEHREGHREDAVMDPATAFVMVNLLMDVVRSGTATRALELKVPLAGKTGTTNGFKDAWFIGFTPEILTGVWVGYRQPRSLGQGNYGADCALPIWIDYMRSVLPLYPRTSYPTPDGVEWARVDAVTGRLARPDTPRAVQVAFRKGTVPTDTAPAPGEVDVVDFFAADKEL